MKNIKNFYEFINEELTILKGPTDEETEDALKNMNGVEIYQLCKSGKLDGSYLEKAVEKGLFKGLKPDAIIVKAAAANSIKYVKKALEDGADVNTIDKYGWTPYTYALENDNKELIDFLVKHGADTTYVNKRITCTYQIVTPESAEDGDYAEQGWENEAGESMVCDDYDIEEGITPVNKAVEYLKKHYANPVGSGNIDHYETYPEENYETGAETTYNYFLNGFTTEEEQEIYKKMCEK